MRQGCMLPAEGARDARSTISRTVFSETGCGKNARHEYRVATASRTSICCPLTSNFTRSNPKAKLPRHRLFARKDSCDFFYRSTAEISGEDNHSPLRHVAGER